MNTAEFTEYDNRSYELFCSKHNVVRDLEILQGLMKGIQCDRTINDAEMAGLEEWLNRDDSLHRHEPFTSIKQLVREAIADHYLSTEEYEGIMWLCNQYLDENGYLNATTSLTRELHGIVSGIALDNHINDKEIAYLDGWLERNDTLKNYWPYDELYSMVTKILRDKIITELERNELLHFCHSLSANTVDNSSMFDTVQQGYFHIDPEIIIPERNFCITGISAKYKRKEIADKIELYGGIVQKNVTQDLHYLVVCDQKNSCWAFTCYGNKVEKAIRYRKQNLPVLIIHELDLFDSFQGYE